MSILGTGQSGNLTDIHEYVGMGDYAAGIIGYWVAVDNAEASTGFQVHMQYTDDLGNTIDQYSSTGDGSTLGYAISGIFYTPTDNYFVEILVLGSSGTLTYSYKINAGPMIY